MREYDLITDWYAGDRGRHVGVAQALALAALLPSGARDRWQRLNLRGIPRFAQLCSGAYIGIRQISLTNSPFFLGETFEAAAGNTPTLTLENAFPSGDGAVTANPAIVAVNRELRNGLSQQWNLTIAKIFQSSNQLSCVVLSRLSVKDVTYDKSVPKSARVGFGHLGAYPAQVKAEEIEQIKSR